MTKISAQDALLLWQEAGLLDREKAGELSDHLLEHAPADHRAVRIFASIGAVLVGLGIILFVASHWDAMSPLLRGSTLFASYGIVVGLAATVEHRGYINVAGALWFLATLTLGANIFLFGQMFNFSLTFWQGPFLWMMGALAMGYATQSRLHAWILIPLSTLTLGWLGGGSGWFTDDQLEFLARSSGLIPMLGLAWVCLGMLARNSSQWRFASDTWLVWGILMIVAPLLLGTIDDWFFVRLFHVEGALKHWLILGSITILFAVTLFYGRFSAKRSQLYFVVVCGLLLLLSIPAEIQPFDLLHQSELFVPYVLLIFVLSLGLIWTGLTAADPQLVNIGLGSASFVIFVQYFSWSFQLLDRSLAFVAGGIVLIGMSLGIEKQRRKLMGRITQKGMAQ